MLYDWQKRRTHPPTEARQESYRQFILAIEAEARADVDGLVARLLAIIEKGANWMAAGSRPTVSNATDDPYTLWLIEVHAVIPAARALLAGNKAEFGTDAHDLPFDGDKAEAPRDVGFQGNVND